MMVAWPLIGFLQLFLHGYNIVGGFLTERALRYASSLER